MKCLKCGALWKIGNRAELLKQCPICETVYINENIASREFTDAYELLFSLLTEEGIDICTDEKRINGYLSDYFPREESLREDIKKLLSHNIGGCIKEVIEKNVPFDDVIHILDRVNLENEDKILKGIKYLCGVETPDFSDISTQDFYLSQVENLPEDIFKVTALERALKLGENGAISARLAHYKKLLGDEDTAKQLLKQGADLGDTDSQYKMASLFLDEGKISEAIEAFEKSASGGNSAAKFRLYQILYSNKSRIKEALKYLEDSAKDFSPAMYEMGIHLIYGDDVKEDVGLGIKFLEEAANAGDIDAINKLAYMYSVGYKVIKDKEKSKIYKSLIGGN